MRLFRIRFIFCLVTLFFLCLSGYSLVIKKKSKTLIPSNRIVLATWNIGHFSHGRKMNSNIGPKEYHDKLIQYRNIIYDTIHPDVLCLQEYSRVFGSDSLGRKMLVSSVFLDGFKTKKEGVQKGYRCNAIYSNVIIKNIRMNFFQSNKKIVSIVPTAANAYYLSSDLYIGGERIDLVCLHLAYSKTTSKVAQNQINELLWKYDKNSKVIICGDWNTSNFTLLKKSGYVLANDGSFKTYPSKSKSLDNIAVKGVKISNVRMIKTSLSDHYPLVCELSI